MASMDVEALYPSINQVAAAKIVKAEYMNSDIEVKDVDWKIVALYLAVTVPEEELLREGIFHLTARKRRNKGRKTTVRNPKISGPLKRSERKPEEMDRQEEEDVIRIGECLDQEMEDTEPDENWRFPRKPVTKEEWKKLFEGLWPTILFIFAIMKIYFFSVF